MLPGFRILLALVVLSLAILIFGFGAIALLRTAHENFASQPTWQPSWRAPGEIAMGPRSDAPPARQETLAMLRVDPPAAKALPDQPVAVTADPAKETAAITAGVPAPPADARPLAAQNAAPPTDQTVQSAEKHADDPVPSSGARSPPEPAQIEAAAASATARVDAPNGARNSDAATTPSIDTTTKPAAETAKAGTPPPPDDATQSTEPPLKMAALPDTASASEIKGETAKAATEPLQPNASGVRAVRRARARLRARRFAAARARAARLAQSGSQSPATATFNNAAPFNNTTPPNNTAPFGLPVGGP